MNTAKSAVSLNNVIAANVICPVCKKYYEEPRTLSECGHTFCKKCLTIHKGYNRCEVSCPECDHLCSVNTDDYCDDIDSSDEEMYDDSKRMLLRNVQTKRIVELVKNANAANDKKVDFGNDSCIHPESKTFSCEHCNSKFCSACLQLHIERLRTEITFIGCRFEERWKRVIQKLIEDQEVIERAIDQAVLEAEEMINDICDSLKEAKDEAISCWNYDSLQSAATKISDEHMRKLKYLTMYRKIAGIPKIDDEKIQEKVNYFANSTMLTLSQEEVIEAHKEFSAQDRRILSMEKLILLPKCGRIVFDQPADDSEQFIQKIEKGITLEWVVNEECSRKASKPPPQHVQRLEQIHASTKKGDLKALRELFEGVHPSCMTYAVEHRDQSDNKFTLLMQAAWYGHFDVAKFLIHEYSANIYAHIGQDSHKRMTIHLALQKSRFDIAKLLFQEDPDLLEMVDNEGKFPTPLFDAVVFNSLSAVKFLVSEMKVQLENRGSSELTPFLEACALGHLEIARYLFEKGADIHARTENSSGDTAAHFAAARGRVEILRYLLDLDPEFANTLSSAGNSILYCAVMKDRIDILKLLIEKNAVFKANKGDNFDIITTTSFYGSSKMCSFVIQNFKDLFQNAKKHYKDRISEKARKGNVPPGLN